MRRLILFSHLALLMAIPALNSCSTKAQEKPNIVLIYVDDWAWNGSPVAMDDAMENSRMPIMQMPNVEKLAAEGMKFRNAYGSPQCSPASGYQSPARPSGTWSLSAVQYVCVLAVNTQYGT